jgi:PPOX class probable F420-dependent enzyme
MAARLAKSVITLSVRRLRNVVLTCCFEMARHPYGTAECVMAQMTNAERDDFLHERRLGTLAIARVGKGPLLAPIWYQYTPDGSIDICMSGTSAKAARLRAEGRASMSVIDEGRPYRYVTVEGPVTITALGEAAHEAIAAMATRYLGEKGGAQYAKQFSDPGEVLVRLTPENWRTEILG